MYYRHFKYFRDEKYIGGTRRFLMFTYNVFTYKTESYRSADVRYSKKVRINARYTYLTYRS